MKYTIQMLKMVSAACLLLLAAGCTSTVRGGQPGTELAALEQIKTRNDAFLAFGTPNNIVHDKGDRLYYFISGLESGGGVGLGAIVWSLLFIEREHLVNNTLVVRIDPNGRVVSFEALDAQHIRRSSIWPGD